MNKVKYANNESVNTNELKDTNNETKNKEPLVTDNSVINVPRYSKPFECGKKILKNLMPRVNYCAWKILRIIIIRNFIIP